MEYLVNFILVGLLFAALPFGAMVVCQKYPDSALARLLERICSDDDSLSAHRASERNLKSIRKAAKKAA